MRLKTTNIKTSAQHKRQVFVEEYLRTLNATQAAIAAGYKGTAVRQTGYELLHDPDIASRIEQGLKQRSEQCRVDTQWVIEQCMAVVNDPRAPHKDRVKALDLLGRYTQAWNGGTKDQTPQRIEITLKEE